MKKCFFLLFLLTFFTVFAAERNVIANGIFEGGTGDVPYCWYFDYSRGSYFADGGPGNSGYVLFSSVKEIKEAALRQVGLILVPGEKYKISCKVRTNNFSAVNPRFLLHDYGWNNEVAVGGFPANTEWKEFSQEIIIPPQSRKGYFGAVIYLAKFKGEIAFADLKLIPLTKKGESGSSNQLDRARKITILEIMTPRLDAVPGGTKTLPVFWCRDYRDSRLTGEVDGKAIGELKFKKGFYRLPVKNEGKHAVKISAFFQGKKVTEKTFEYTVMPIEKKSAEKRLNAFTTELVNKNLKSAKRFVFTVPRRSWIYFKFESAEKVNALLKGAKNPLITEKYHRKETQRHLEPGEYTIDFSRPYTGTVVIRTVPVIYKYAGIRNTIWEERGADLAFHDKHVFGVFNTMGTWGIPEELRSYTNSIGMESTGGIAPPTRKSYNKENIGFFRKQLLNPKGAFYSASSQWVEFDEYYWNTLDGLLVASDALESLKNPKQKSLFHWFGGTSGPNTPGVHHKVVNSFMNAGGGRGYIAYEVYFESKLTEQQAKEDIEKNTVGALERMNAFVPDSNRAFGFIYGCFHQLPVLSIDFHPGVNYKYFLDMQFRAIAADPRFNGIGLTGYWGCHYASEETIRWCCELVRHYVLEGKTEMLSEKYGYTYQLPHLKNGDFEEGLTAWHKTGDIVTGEHRNFGALNELRWRGAHVGNHFALFRGHAGKPNTLTQTAEQLIPGKSYYLEFITADYDDTKAVKVAPRVYPVSVELPGAKILKEYTFVDKRSKSHYGAVTGKTNYRYIRFVPSKSTQKLIFKDAGKEGENLIMNFVRVAPYFTK